jgi:hypothetical protein
MAAVRAIGEVPRSLDGSGQTSTESYRSANPRRAPLSDKALVPRPSCGRDEVTVTAILSRVVSTVPFWSVRKTRDEWARRRAIVAPFGWPYGLFAPTETTATSGRTVARSTSDEAVALP